MKTVLYLITLFSCLNSAASEPQKENLYEIGAHFLKTEQTDSATYTFSKLIEAHSKKGNGAINAFIVGKLYRNSFLFEEANYYLNQALTYSDTLKNTILYSDIRNEIGLLYYDQHYYANALSEFSLNIKLCANLKDTFGLAIAYINIGNVYKETDNLNDALDYYQRGLDYSQAKNDTILMSLALTNLGSIHFLKHAPRHAITYFEKALTLSKTSPNSLNLAHIQVNMGLCKSALKNYKSAKHLFELSLLNYKKTENLEGIYLCYINLYHVSTFLKLNKESNQYKSLALDPKFDICKIKSKIDFYTYLKDDSFMNKDSSSALLYTTKLLELGKALIENIRNRELTTLKTDFNFTHVNQQLNETVLNLKKETAEKNYMNVLNSKLKKQNNLNLLLFFIGLILLLSLVIILNRSNNHKRKTNINLANQKKLVEEKNVEILNSITYATSMEKLLLQQMNPHFLYNALTTIEASISVGDIQFAKNYLILFSDLLRKTLDHSRKDVISLVEEIDFLKAYIALNTDKQGSHFNYEFEYNLDEVEDFVFTPPMLVQPFIENALIHGLYHKTDGEKKLKITIQPKENHIIWTIIDNGIGRTRAKQIGKTHKGVSHGIKITVDRIHWMKKRYGSNFSIEYTDLPKGTQVILKTPILDSPT